MQRCVQERKNRKKKQIKDGDVERNATCGDGRWRIGEMKDKSGDK
jgi:hypothetical protein